MVVHRHYFCFLHFLVLDLILHVKFDCFAIYLVVFERVGILIVVFELLVSVEFHFVRRLHFLFVALYFVGYGFFPPLLLLLGTAVELVYRLLLYLGDWVVDVLQRLNELIQTFISADHLQPELFIQLFPVKI